MSAYRRDIDGLRALAVLPVVLYHAGIPGFSGGYVGVDIFFVISGFLITDIVAAEVRGGHFSLASFYERRIRRIFPALFAMLAVVFVAGWCLLLAGDLADLGRSAAATAVFGSNFYFWQQAGYFEASSELRPLLHTWSLAVEEQFYVVLPLAVLLLQRGGRLAAWLCAAFVLSLAVSAWGVSREPSAAYYLAPARAWELLLGSLIAIGAAPAVSSARVRETLALAGLAMIVASVTLYTDRTPFPGLAALLPCVGAALLLHTGKGTRAGRWLSLPPLVFVGLLSYSLYLWHWPLFAFARHLSVEPLAMAPAAALAALSLLLAWLSWRWIETPVRTRAILPARRALFLAAAVATAVFVLAGLALHAGDGVPSRLPPAVAAWESAKEARAARHYECLALPRHPVAPADACVFGKPGVAPAWALWGDSHAASLAESFGEVLAARGESLLLLASASCPPVREVVSVHATVRCPEYVRAALAEVARRDIRHVVLAARWAIAAEGFDPALGPAEKGRPREQLRDPAGVVVTDDATRRAYLRQQLLATVQELRAAGRDVVIVYPVPETGYDIPSTLARLQWRGESAAGFARPRALYERRQAWTIALLDEAATLPGVRAVRSVDAFCDAAQCRVAADGISWYVDDNHVSREGAHRVAQVFAALPDAGDRRPAAETKSLP